MDTFLLLDIHAVRPVTRRRRSDKLADAVIGRLVKPISDKGIANFVHMLPVSRDLPLLDDSIGAIGVCVTTSWCWWRCRFLSLRKSKKGNEPVSVLEFHTG